MRASPLSEECKPGLHVDLSSSGLLDCEPARIPLPAEFLVERE
jgi:hypothetical protein